MRNKCGEKGESSLILKKQQMIIQNPLRDLNF